MVYKIGDEILRCTPFSYAIREQHRHKVCDFCLSSGQGKVRKCLRCCVIYYCGKQCQMSSWAEVHKHECKYLKMLDSKEPPKTLLLIVRTLCKLTFGGGYSEEVTLPNGRSRRFVDLISHKDNILMDSARKDAFFTYLTIIRNKIGGAMEIKESEVLDIFTKILINSGFMLNDTLLNIGTSLSLEFSAIDHSCRPNAIYMFTGRQIVVKALCDIANFDDVRIAYIGNIEPRSIRQKMLSHQYFFDCDCEECTDDPLNLEKIKSHSPCCPQCKNLLDDDKCINCNKEVNLFRYFKIKEILKNEKEMNAKTCLYFVEVLKYFHPFDYVSYKFCDDLIARNDLIDNNKLQILYERNILTMRKYGCIYDIQMSEYLINLIGILLSKQELKSVPNLLFEAKAIMEVIYPHGHSIFEKFDHLNLFYLQMKNT
ncbi:histone-lysine N-methyltransferase SMYD3 isoform X1 [Lepeophtheirus salmonis]|uniref:histone-lysine N-methyltransferase SMYD3 isoform X1 n=1 Tax=Lepeophtheirus salmonis TaxID=72036 RepID=UPI001AE1FA40|nr:histone-lysine N-methyltransferase SMYD3-like isoform X1 [Lepeophtheirus salmonis]